MRNMTFAASAGAALRVVCLFSFAVAATFGQQQVNLTAGPTSITLPDGTAVPMWGYTCTPLAQGVTSTATCGALNKTASGWSPVVITVPTGSNLQINLTNNLVFTPAGSSTPNPVPTSLTIVGQVGGGLGAGGKYVPGPAHTGASQTTWPIVAPANQNFTPPPQGRRVQSFATEVAACTGTSCSATVLTWTAPREGTYLLESGTHPSIQGPMGLYGIVIVTAAPATNAAGVAYSQSLTSPIKYDADVPLLMSEIDPVQNNAVNAAVNTAGFTETAVWSGQPNGCGNPSSPTYQTCYPPAVNYSPLYYLFNGVAFDKTNPSASTFPASIPIPAATSIPTGQLLVRFVNAGLRMHVPSIVGAQTASGANPVGGFSLIAEDGNPLPGVPRVQSEVFMAAGKTYDVMINGPAAGATALPVYDRELSLSGGGTQRDAGMLAYISVNGSGVPAAAALAGATANPDTYKSVVPGKTLTVSDPSRGVIANDVNVYGVKANLNPQHGTLVLAANGTFTYVPNSDWTATSTPATTDSFTYIANGNSNLAALVTLNLAPIEGATGITAGNATFTSPMATYMAVRTPGVLAYASDGAGYPLTAATSSVVIPTGSQLSVTLDQNGGFVATAPTNGTYTFTYQAQNSQGTMSAAATITLNFLTGSGLKVNVVDGYDKSTLITDYRWIIEEDRSFYVDPNNTTNTSSGIVPTLGVNFHASTAPFVAQGCTGPQSCEAGQTVQGNSVVCDVGNGLCRPGSQLTQVTPDQVNLDPTKRYYFSVLPGDAAIPFTTGNTSGNCQSGSSAPGAANCGHTMGGAPIGININGGNPLLVLAQPAPLPPGQLSVFVFEDDFPLNGEQDAGGGVDVLAPNEPGLGGFQIHLWDAMGQNGDFTGQMTYDMFNQPLTNSLAGFKDPATGFDACPITKSGGGITGMIVTCPKYESDGKTLSPLAGQAIVANLMPGRWGVVATPGADRIARGEEWLQTNTLDGQKAHDVFTRIGEPSYFQEYGPSSYHVTIGFANPAIINGRKAGVCAGTDINLTLTGTPCSSIVTGRVTTQRMSRTPDERLYSSGSHDSFYFSQCYVSVGDPDGEDFAFTKCNADGSFSLSNLPAGQWRVTVFDQWNDGLVDGLSTPVALTAGKTTDLKDVAVTQWQANLYTRTFIDDNKDGVSQSTENGIPLIPINIRRRDGSLENNLITDFTGTANFNETFPLFNWYVVESDTTRYKTTGTHVVYDAGGPADGTACGSPYPACGSSTIGKYLANTIESVPLPANLRVPGAVYCADADCSQQTLQTNKTGGGPGGSTGRIDPPWVGVEGFQGFSGQNNFIEFGKTPYQPGENGGIRGHVVYASTRPFDDPDLLVQTQWEPLVPHVTINLYQEGTAPDGSKSLKLADTTQTSSFDDWAQGFRSDGMPNMNCPGQITGDLFYFSLFNQPNYLNVYNQAHGGPAAPTLPNNSQYKCYDGMHNWNQIQPAPYDGMYAFPSSTGVNPTNGQSVGTNCKICIANPADGTNMLPTGKYVVEVVVPPGYELVKEEDKNILIGDNFIAPATQQFAGFGDIFILPDQAQVASSYNANNAQNPTVSLGTTPINQGVPGFPVEPVWPCVGEARVVPDYISLFPGSKEVAPFAGATRNLCDRKEVTLGDQMATTAKFYIFTSTHIASHFTGVITDDFTSEFDPFSPQFGEKFAPPNLPVSIKDWTGAEVSRVYADHWGAYNGMQYSTWEVNPPNPTGYSPTMAIMCMNDAGSGSTPDPLFNPGYSQFCYELPFMPGTTSYLDTPVVPTSAFSEGYNHPDCAYPNATPAISEVDGDRGKGPYVSAPGKSITITALGDQLVQNNGYSGPSATTAPFNQKTVTRHYGFGSAQGTVTIGGKTAVVTGWSDMSITATVPNNVPACPVQQQAQYGGPGQSGSPALCGQLVVTAADGQQSVDAVTITIGGKAPTYVAGTIQSAIDAAAPGDLIMVPPGVYNELLIMWKPVRLQGVGAVSSVINANTHPAGKLDPWRHRVNCLFGLAINGQPYTAAGGSNPYSTGTDACPATGMSYFTGGPNNPQVDRLPLEGILGWDTSVNGNLAQLLQEPTLLGAYEGAGITVLSKGVNIPAGATNPFGSGSESAFPTGSTVLTSANCGTDAAPGSPALVPNPYSSNFQCNPSAIDGLSVTNSSQGGGGIFVHAWSHNLQIANNRVYNNIGTLSGGINIGQGESPDAYLAGTPADSDPGSCLSGAGMNPNKQLPYCFNLRVNVHNNAVTLNSSIGDELFSGTPAGAGGVSFCTGADYYKFDYNWVCGNMSTGDGGGFAHLGFIWNGEISHNSILFNESTNPTISTNGGGLIVMGAPPDGTINGVECGGTAADADCTPGLSDGTGPGLVINANLIQGNAAESGSGGGLRFQDVDGTEVSLFPTSPSQWYNVKVTNNIIANNVAGWDGGGVSLQDALAVDFVNNTVISNDSTASAGPLFNTLGSPLASAPGASNQTSAGGTSSLPQPAGLVAIQNSPQLVASFAGITKITCPANHPGCTSFSNPYLANDIFWQNRSFFIGVGALSAQYQQNIVSLYNASFNGAMAAQAPSQPATPSSAANGSGSVVTGGTGACPAASYWDIGVRGDSGPSNHALGTLSPTYSVLTDAADYTAGNNFGSNPTVISQYCNGSRTPPENSANGGGWQVPPGISDATVPNPIFNLTPSATVDEGNNWVNISWGPLATTNAITKVNLGNYAPAINSPAIDAIPATAGSYATAPATDFFGNARPDVAGTSIDIGAVEYRTAPPTLVSINPTTGDQGTTVAITFIGTALDGANAIKVTAQPGATNGITVTNITAVNSTTVTANFVIAKGATVGARAVAVVTPSGTTNTLSFGVTAPLPPTLTSITPNSGVIGTSVNVSIVGANLTGGVVTTSVNPAILVVSNIVVVSPTNITATFTINPGAGAGAKTVRVITPVGASNTLAFTVSNPPLPALTAISTPNGTQRGGTVALVLQGTNLSNATAVTVSGTGVTSVSITSNTATTVTANVVLANNATLTARSVRVVTANGTSNIETFTVTAPPAPTITGISPNSGTRGSANIPIVISGTNLLGATMVTASGNYVNITGFTVVNATTIKATISIDQLANPTTRTIRVTTPGGTSAASAPATNFAVK